MGEPKSPANNNKRKWLKKNVVIGVIRIIGDGGREEREGGRVAGSRESWRCVSKGCGSRSCCLERVDLRPFHKYRYKQITTIITEQLQLTGGINTARTTARAARIIRNVFFIAHIYTCRSNALWDSPLAPGPVRPNMKKLWISNEINLLLCYTLPCSGWGVRVFICWRAHNYPASPSRKQLDPRMGQLPTGGTGHRFFSPSVLPLTPSPLLAAFPSVRTL